MNTNAKITIVDVKHEQKRHWAHAVILSILIPLIILWRTASLATAILTTTLTATAFYLGYLYAKDIEPDLPALIDTLQSKTPQTP